MHAIPGLCQRTASLDILSELQGIALARLSSGEDSRIGPTDASTICRKTDAVQYKRAIASSSSLGPAFKWRLLCRPRVSIFRTRYGWFEIQPPNCLGAQLRERRSSSQNKRTAVYILV